MSRWWGAAVVVVLGCGTLLKPADPDRRLSVKTTGTTFDSDRGYRFVVLPDDTFSYLVSGRDVRIGGAREAAEAFVGHRIAANPEVSLPGRLERRNGEIRDGAHNADGARYLVERLPAEDHTLVVSILADKDVDEMLRQLRRAGSCLIATRSSSERALQAEDLAAHARGVFDHVEVVENPIEALARAHELGEPVLVTGSLYLLGDIAQAERRASCRG